MLQETFTNPKPSRGNSLQDELLRRRATLKRNESFSGFGCEGSRSNGDVRMGGTLERRGGTLERSERKTTLERSERMGGTLERSERMGGTVERSGRRLTNTQLTSPPPLAPKKKPLPTKAKPTLSKREIDETINRDNESREQQKRKITDIALSNVGTDQKKMVSRHDVSIPFKPELSVPIPQRYDNTNPPETKSWNPATTIIATHCSDNERQKHDVPRLEVRSKLEQHVLNQEVGPPLIPKRVQSVQKTNSFESIAPQNEQLDQQRRDSGSHGRGRGKKDRERVPGTATCITPLGSSSESDYSGDGNVRRLKSNVRSSVMKQQPQFQHENTKKSVGRKVKSSTKTHTTHGIASRIVKTELENNPKTIQASDAYGGMDDVTSPLSAINLTDFISNYSHLLPSQVVIQEDNGSKMTNTCISKGKKLLLHFIKKTNVVMLSDDKEIYSIPVSSNIRFGLIYNPIEADNGVSSYMRLPTIGDVMKLKQLPILITAMTSHDGGLPEKSVIANEILFIKGIVAQRMGGRQLHVVNASNTEKFLSEKCAGNFSTDPHHMKLHLSTLLLHEIELPQYVIIYPEHDLKEVLPKSMINYPLLLGSKKEEDSVVATWGELRDHDSGSGPLIDLASELNIKVEPVRLSESEKNLLKEATVSIYENFEPTKCQSFSEKTSTNSINLQCHFYQNLLEDGNNSGMNLLLPTCCSQAAPFSRSIEDNSLKQGGLLSIGSGLSLNRDDFGSSQRGSLTSNSSYLQDEPSLSVGWELPGAQCSNVGAVSNQEDAMSISSHTSMNLNSSETHSHSSQASNVFDSNIKTEPDEDEDGTYEDIDDIRDDYEAEKKKIQESMKQKSNPSSSSSSKVFANMFKSKKSKKLKQSEKLEKSNSEPLENTSQGHLKDVTKSNAHLTEKLPDTLSPSSRHMTSSHAQDCSSSGSHDEVKSIEADQDNYEYIGSSAMADGQPPPLPPTFNPPFPKTPNTTTSSSCSTTPSLPVSPLPPLENVDQWNMKSKLLQRPLITKTIASEVQSTCPSVSESNSNYDDVTMLEHVVTNKMKMKDTMMAKKGSSSHSFSAAAPLKKSTTTREMSGENHPPLDSNKTILVGEEMTRLHAEVDGLRADLKELSIFVEKLAAQVNGQQVPFSASLIGNGGKTPKNKLVEDSLRIAERKTDQEVLRLPDHTKHYAREKVSDSRRSMLDDATLKDGKLHRIRVPNVSAGHASVHPLQK